MHKVYSKSFGMPHILAVAFLCAGFGILLYLALQGNSVPVYSVSQLLALGQEAGQNEVKNNCKEPEKLLGPEEGENLKKPSDPEKPSEPETAKALEKLDVLEKTEAKNVLGRADGFEDSRGLEYLEKGEIVQVYGSIAQFSEPSPSQSPSQAPRSSGEHSSSLLPTPLPEQLQAPEQNSLEFLLEDQEKPANKLAVKYTGIIPSNLKLQQAIFLTGKYDYVNKKFLAYEIVTSYPTKYQIKYEAKHEGKSKAESQPESQTQPQN